MLNKKVIAKEDILYYCEKGKIYDLEHIYTGGTYLQYLVRGNYENHWKIAKYFDAKLFDILDIPEKKPIVEDELHIDFSGYTN